MRRPGSSRRESGPTGRTAGALPTSCSGPAKTDQLHVVTDLDISVAADDACEVLKEGKARDEQRFPFPKVPLIRAPLTMPGSAGAGAGLRGCWAGQGSTPVGSLCGGSDGTAGDGGGAECRGGSLRRPRRFLAWRASSMVFKKWLEHHTVGDVTSIVVLVVAPVMPLVVTPLVVMVFVIARMPVTLPLRPPAIIAVVPAVLFPLVAGRTR